MTFGLFAIFSCALTYLLSVQNANVTMERLKDRVKSIAVTAAIQFEATDIEKINEISDVKKSEYIDIVRRLNRIRHENSGVMFAYILRPTSQKGMWRFVADADALNPFEVKDVDGDGKISDADHLAAPGEFYVETSQNEEDLFKLYDASSYDPETDKWGTHISGTAPILDAKGKVVAIIGIDIETSYWDNVSHSSFLPLLSFTAFFLIFVFIRLGAYNNILFIELMRLHRFRS